MFSSSIAVPANALSPIEVTDAGITTTASDVAPLNADSPILSTSSGISKLVRVTQSRNAKLGISVHDVGMVTCPLVGVGSIVQAASTDTTSTTAITINLTRS
jgi:hypothetical protein